MARYFPQLAGGAFVQFPARRACRWRTIITETADGRRIKYADDHSPMIEWRYTFQALSDLEAGQIREFFLTCGGRLLEFTFADPFDNLLRWSEDFRKPHWDRPPWLTIEAGRADPFGGQRAFRMTNTGVTTARLGQAVAIPGYYACAFTMYARSETAGRIRLTRSADGAEDHADAGVDAVWQRALARTQLPASGDTSVFACEIEPQMTVDLFGAQVEGHPQPTSYKRNFSRGGVYPRCRFAQDDLQVVSQAPNDHDILLHFESPWSL